MILKKRERTNRFLKTATLTQLFEASRFTLAIEKCTIKSGKLFVVHTSGLLHMLCAILTYKERNKDFLIVRRTP